MPRRGLRQIALYGSGTWCAGRLPGWVTYAVTDLVSATVARFPSDVVRQRRAVVAAHLARISGSGARPRPLRAAEAEAAEAEAAEAEAAEAEAAEAEAAEAEAAEAEAAVDATFRSYGRYWAENLRLPAVGPAGLSRGMSSDGFAHLFAAHAKGRGVILALPHLGGWEWGGAWLAAQGYPVSVVVEPLDPPEVFAWFVRLRRSLGLEVIPAGPAAGAATLRALRAGRILCLLCDRVVGEGSGVEANFFGARTLLPAGPVLLGLRSGAPILAAAVYFAPRGPGAATLGRPGHLAVVRPPLALERTGARHLRADLERGTQALAGELEILIRRAPTQWHLMQPNWPGDPGWEGSG